MEHARLCTAQLQTVREGLEEVQRSVGSVQEVRRLASEMQDEVPGPPAPHTSPQGVVCHLPGGGWRVRGRCVHHASGRRPLRGLQREGWVCLRASQAGARIEMSPCSVLRPACRLLLERPGNGWCRLVAGNPP